MRSLLLSFAAFLLATCTSCVPAEFFQKLGNVATVMGKVAGGVGAVSEKLTVISEKMAEKENLSINDLMGLGIGLLGGGALAGGTAFGVSRNGRRKTG